MSRTRAVVLVWLAVAGWSGGLHLRAALDPPPGRAFAGNFHWIDDFYNYLTYAQQAQDGQLLFRNKLAPPAPGVLFNAEWWLVGTASRWLGGRLLLTYALFGALSTLALLLAAELWLSSLSVAASHRSAALLLMAFGGGFGGLLFEFTDLPASRCADISLGLFPFLEVVGNPHFVAGTALLLWSAWLLSEAPPSWGPAAGIVTGSLLALVRPYDVGLLVAMRIGAVTLLEPRSRWRRALLPLLGLAPALAYDVWVFFGTRQFAAFRQGGTFPVRLECAAALAPAALLALAEWRRAARGEAHRRARAQLWTWVLVVLALVTAGGGGIGLQLLVGGGLPLLLLAGAALAEQRTAATVLAALLMSSSAVVETRILLQDDPNWFVPEERLAAARALRVLCRPGDRVFSPADVGLFAAGLSSCDSFVSHRAGPDYDARVAATRSFYSASEPGTRSALLDAERITHLVLPGWAGPQPAGWLGPATAFRAAATIGSPRPLLTIYARPGSKPAR